MIGTVFNIQRFSTHDGPGIRTTAFLKGCSLRCRWCHNPEGMDEKIGLQYIAKNCIGCRACAAVCPNGVHRFTQEKHGVDFSRCIFCGRCIVVCPAKALCADAYNYMPEQAALQLCRDLPFYCENGGVTFSGGEPLLQAAFVAETAAICKKNGVKSVGIDTAGMVPWSAFLQVLPVADFFLFDIKAATEKLHIEGTGCSNRLILENLEKLDGQGLPIYLRIPVIPDFNDTPEEMGKIAEIVRPLRHVKEIRLIPYHTLGIEKYETLGMKAPLRRRLPDEQSMERLRQIFREQTTFDIQ